jgi:TRAP-type C4-dicarboxylate transport system permease small subunit
MDNMHASREPAFERFLAKTVLYSARGGGYLMLATAIMISTDVIIRKLFSVTLIGAAELSGFAFAGAASWAFAFAVFKKAHVRVDVFYRLAPLSVKSLLDVFSMISLAVVSCLLTWYVTALLVEAVELNSESALLRLPLWIPHLICSLGLVLFSISSLYVALKMLLLLIRHDYRRINELAGVAGE